ncbi:class I SAM-dependent methyltransferase [Streptomyces cavernicola]|uniref:Class I SAM-dependent methyltransferase n=1 Tax=Streptomyces cavernicola TaxID=3043613 RepID=A0ABT6S4K9_9ACTN|nr:class I SAM-dependent methyltransferase [Streptomyces sp. B-S-A6]MDI3402353.1 class I SAM-dependent methyltransferase [Streptomyces sp. B-S-A6]
MSTSRTELTKPNHLDEVPGWFKPLDQALFGFFLEETADRPGDLLEMGCYLGKATIVMGRHRGDGETFTVCDLFGDETQGSYSRKATLDFYEKTLSLRAFENNYLAFHEQLPEIVQARTDVLADRIAEDSCRFVHVDASHQYEDVCVDIDTTRTILRRDGVVSLDDYRNDRTPGVGAAVWESVFTKGMRPVCVTPNKMYATWDDPSPLQKRLREWAGETRDCVVAEDLIDGAVMLRLSSTAVKHGGPSLPKPRSSALKRIACDVLPPVVTRAVRRARRPR